MPSCSANSGAYSQPTNRDIETLLATLADRDIDPVVATLLETLVAERDRLHDRIDDLEQQLTRTHDIATTASAKSEQTETRVDDLTEDHEKTRDIARSAVAKAQQLDAEQTDEQDDTASLPAGVEPSSSPLDFFANCRQQTVKRVFVEESNRQNTYRAITVAKRWPEFATERLDGSGVFFTKDDVTTALTAALGKQPHRQTVHRVWTTLQDLGGDDLQITSRQVGRSQSATEILVMDRQTAEGLLEKRYLELDLLDGQTATAGGITPVVTDTEGARV